MPPHPSHELAYLLGALILMIYGVPRLLARSIKIPLWIWRLRVISLILLIVIPGYCWGMTVQSLSVGGLAYFLSGSAIQDFRSQFEVRARARAMNEEAES